jgi:hypothetical protein
MLLFRLLSGRVFDGGDMIESGDHVPVSALREPQSGPSRSTMLTALSLSKGMVEGPLVG